MDVDVDDNDFEVDDDDGDGVVDDDGGDGEDDDVDFGFEVGDVDEDDRVDDDILMMIMKVEWIVQVMHKNKTFKNKIIKLFYSYFKKCRVILSKTLE